MKYIFLLLLATLSPALAAADTEGAAKHAPIKTYGVHHVGLAVKDLEVTSAFFTKALGFKKVDERPDYPAHFVTDGNQLITLWQVSEPDTATSFDRKRNIGLHHMAFQLGNFEDLERMHKRLKNWPGVRIEFAPEPVGKGPAEHMIFYEPGGIRLEFIVVPQ